jgi:hypothetical protein
VANASTPAVSSVDRKKCFGGMICGMRALPESSIAGHL